MSLVSTYVQDAEGNWHKNPSLYNDTGNWYLCYDDSDPIELVVKSDAWH